MQPSKSWSIITIAAVALVFGVVGGGLGAYLYGRGTATAASSTAAGPAATRPGPVRVITEEDAIIEAIEQASPAVVKIVSTRIVEPRDLFEWLFGGGRPREQQGIGSGFIFDHEGQPLILTNAHVVGGADRLTVKLPDGTEFEAEKLGIHPDYDIAVIKPISPPTDLPTVSLGDSLQVRVGQWVIALGNPFGFENTATLGIVSAMDYRQIRGQNRYVIQTDAAINLGNSGGPLVDLGGNAIGINYAIYSPTATSLGIGFAIPINQAKEMMYFLVNRGPWIGLLDTRPNSPGLARWVGLSTDKGVVVVRVASQGPLARAGVRRGDVILQADGKLVANAREIEEIVLGHKIEDVITFTIQRDTERLDISVQAGTIPAGYY